MQMFSNNHHHHHHQQYYYHEEAAAAAGAGVGAEDAATGPSPPGINLTKAKLSAIRSPSSESYPNTHHADIVPV